MIDSKLPIKPQFKDFVYINLKIVDHSIAKTKFERLKAKLGSKKKKELYSPDDSYLIPFTIFSNSASDLPQKIRIGDLIKVTGAEIDMYQEKG